MAEARTAFLRRAVISVQEQDSQGGPGAGDYLHTFGLESLVLICQVLVFKLAAIYWGTIGFSEYALTRRAVSLLQPALTVGLSVALPRYVARAAGKESYDAGRFLRAAMVIAGLGTVMWLGLLLTWDRKAAALFYGEERYAPFAHSLALMLVGLSLHVVLYGYLRGTMRQRVANWLQLVNLGLWPVFVFVLPGLTVPQLLNVLSGLWIATSLPVLVWIWRHETGPASIQAELTSLLGYGITRVPGEFLQMALFGVPAILVAHLVNVEAAGRIAFGISVVGMFGTAFAPVGLVLLPTASRTAGTGQLEGLGRHVRGLIVGVAGTTVPLAVLLGLMAPVILRLYLGPGFGDTVDVVRVASLAVLPMALFMVLRSVVDGVYERALTTRNLGLGFLAFLLGVPLAVAAPSPAIALMALFTAGLSVSAIMTVRDALRATRRTGL